MHNEIELAWSFAQTVLVIVGIYLIVFIRYCCRITAQVQR